MVCLLLFFRRQRHIIAECFFQIAIISHGDWHIFSLKWHKHSLFEPFFFVFLFHIKWTGTQFCDVITLGNRIFCHMFFCEIPDLIAYLFPAKYRKQKAASGRHQATMFFRYRLCAKQLINKRPHALKFTFPFSLRVPIQRNHIQCHPYARSGDLFGMA